MITYDITGEPNNEWQGRKPKTSTLAIMAVLFGAFGPFSTGALLVMSWNSFLKIGNTSAVLALVCSVVWILGLALGMKSLQKINSSGGQLTGREYAITGIALSAAWMLVILTAVLLPGLFYVNS